MTQRYLSAQRASTVDAVVDVGGGTEYAVLQDADDALDAGAYSLWVKSGTYAAGLTVTTDKVHIYFEPGTVIEAALVFSGTDISVEFGPGCDVQGTITFSDARWNLLDHGKLTTTGLVLSGANGTYDGGGRSSLHNGGTTNDGIAISATDITVRNCAAQTTAGGGATKEAIGILAGGDRAKVLHCVVIDADDVGIQVLGDDCLIEGNLILGADDHGMYVAGVRSRIIGNSVVATGAVGIGFDGAGDNGLICDNMVRDPTGDPIDIAAACEDCVIVGNRTDGAIDDNSGTSTNTGNEETGF